MSERAQVVDRKRRRVRWWLVRAIRPRHKEHYGGFRDRMCSLLIARHPWWDWGHRLMILTGSYNGGNWAEPEPPTWWYREVGKKQMARTGYPRRVLGVVKDYDEFRRLTEGLNEDELYGWSALAFDQDGELILGHRYWGKAFYGLRRDELRLLRRYLRMASRHDWWGLRSWLWKQGLHAAVYRKKPFTCGATPPRGQGGYDHWRCALRRRHEGLHRFGNYVFGEVAGEPIGAHFRPKADSAPRDEMPRGAA